jgi:hypothetical protein
MAFQPPTRPHSANPHITLNSSIFRPSSAASNRTKASIPSPTRKTTGQSHEWEDAWDSGSDHDDDQPSRSEVAPIPISNGNGHGHQRQTSGSSVVAASWASGSYQHISHRPTLATSKTYTEGATPPPPGTASPTTMGEASGSKLPPGGAWELVDPVVEDAEDMPPIKAGKEAIREDANEILRGMSKHEAQLTLDPLQLLSSLHISSSAPSTPTTNITNPSSIFPFLPSASPSASTFSIASYPEAGSTTPKSMSRKEGIHRQRSVRTERRREKFAKVLRGRDEDGNGVDLGALLRSKLTDSQES